MRKRRGYTGAFGSQVCRADVVVWLTIDLQRECIPPPLSIDELGVQN